MYIMKSVPEDFIVKEISSFPLKENGMYAICLLKKRNYTTLRAMEEISEYFHIPLAYTGFAGTKDKNAVTEQKISMKGVKKEKIASLRLKDIELTFLGYADELISLGQLEGNEFIITVRNLLDENISSIESKCKKKLLMPNYFGEQRFSTNNKEIGKAIVKGNYPEAIALILQTNSDYGEKIVGYGKNYPAALQAIPKKLLKIYIHSYQSCLWNKSLSMYLKKKKENIHIPIIGFGTEVDNEAIGEIIAKIMEEEFLSYRDFINRKIPSLSSEGGERKAIVEIKNLKVMGKENDTLILSFFLEKGSYATIAVAFLLDCLDTALKDFF